MQTQMRQFGDGRSFIPIESLNRISSIVAVQEAPTVSNKYSFFSTMDLIKALASEQWFPVLAQEQRVRETEREGFQKHMVRFRNPDISNARLSVGDIFPEIVLTNAHDARAAYVLMAGFFRLACSNGMIVSEGEFGSIRFRHMGFDPKDVIDASYKVVKEIPLLAEKIGNYRAIQLKPEEKEIFAESALALKYDTEIKREGENVLIDDRKFSIPALLKPTRTQDSDPSLWNTFSTVQEKFTKGNNFERTTRVVNGQIRQQTKVRGIKGLDENVRVNKGLWHLMEKMRELKS